MSGKKMVDVEMLRRGMLRSPLLLLDNDGDKLVGVRQQEPAASLLNNELMVQQSYTPLRFATVEYEENCKEEVYGTMNQPTSFV
ncbi:hypothetical protein Ciccas_004704 [Cichlidogyrus casuarinus]|uniref:Uncharacterized protein n=1 Tax=Cichlidogyrus casuarinus TaxID=1844966 RepID=A0ABD2QAP7_9PLAT